MVGICALAGVFIAMVALRFRGKTSGCAGFPRTRRRPRVHEDAHPPTNYLDSHWRPEDRTGNKLRTTSEGPQNVSQSRSPCERTKVVQTLLLLRAVDF